MDNKSFVNISGKTVLITQCATDIGRDISILLATFGCHLIVTDNDENAANLLAKELNKDGGNVTAFAFNPENEKEVKHSLRYIFDQYGPVNILINNFGFDSLSTDDLGRHETGIYSQFLFCREIYPLMKKAGGGQIVNIAPTLTVEHRKKAKRLPSKHGIVSFSNHLYDSGRKYEIRVTALIAGGMKTPLLESLFPDLDELTTQDAKNITEAVIFILTMPKESIVPEVMVLPLQEV